ERVDDVARDPVFEDFLDRTAAKCDDRCAACERFDHDEAEGLGPVDRKEQRPGSAKKAVLIGLSNLTDVVDQRVVEKRPYLLLEIFGVGAVDLGSDLQRPT